MEKYSHSYSQIYFEKAVRAELLFHYALHYMYTWLLTINCDKIKKSIFH